MSAVHTLPVQAAVDATWERFSALVRAANDDRRLWEDRAHVERTIVAHEAFRRAFLAMERDQ